MTIACVTPTYQWQKVYRYQMWANSQTSCEINYKHTSPVHVVYQCILCGEIKQKIEFMGNID